MTSPAREIAFLANPAAGKGRSAPVVGPAVARLRRAGLVVHEILTADPLDAERRLRDAVEAGVDGVVAAGGDGTLHHALQVVAGTDVTLGCIPSGTGNDAARSIGVPLHDPVAAVDRIVAGRTRRVDAARTGDRWFMTVMAAGFDAVVNERANQMTWPRGQMRYNVATLAELRTFRPLPYTLELDGQVRELEAMLVAVGNGPSFGGGLRITQGAEVDDGLLDVVVIKPVSKLELVKTYPKLFKGTHVTHPQYERIRARRVTVAAPGVVAYADGERLAPLPLTVECVPAAVEVWA